MWRLSLLLLIALAVPSAVRAVDFAVDSTADGVDQNPGDGTCSTAANECTLRAAVMEANASVGSDRILIPAGSYALSIAATLTVTDAEGDLDVTEDLTVIGAGMDDTTLVASALRRMFVVSANVSFTVESLAIVPGQPVMGTLDSNARIVDSGSGSSLVFDTVRVLPMAATPLPSYYLIRHTGTSLLIDSMEASLERVQMLAQVEPAVGPAMVVIRDSTLTLPSDSTAPRPGFIELDTTEDATLLVERVTVDAGGYTPSLSLFGVEARGSSTVDFTLIDSSVRELAEGIGALAVLSSDTATLDVEIARSSFEGGIFLSPSSTGTPTVTFEIVDSFVDSSTYLQDFYYSIVVRSSTLIAPFVELWGATLSGSTVVTETFRSDIEPSTMRNSILIGECYGASTVISQGYNLFSDSTNCTYVGDTTGDLVDVDPQLDVVADNGGPTLSRAPLAGSPTLDAGNPATPGSGGAACEGTDQRGVARPQDGTGDLAERCDIGAVESMGVPDPVLDYGDAPAPYPTVTADDGPRHRVGSLFLGAGVSAEEDAIPSAGADSDDDDGVVFLGPFVPGSSTEVEVTASEEGTLEMWWDFGQDGVWSDPGEQQPVQQGIPAGTSTFFIDVPWAAPTGDTYMRARISSVLTNPTGSAPDGEVEDHQITVVEPPFVRAYVGEDREVALGGTVRVGASPAADGGVPPYTYSWSVDPVTGYSLNAASDPNPAFTPAEVAEFEVCMAVDDSVVGNDEACLTIYSFCAQTVNQDPSFTSDNGFVDYWAAVSIASADYTVMGGGDVAFFAGSSIGLESGFRVESGGRFQATIDPGIDASCGEQAIRRRAPER